MASDNELPMKVVLDDAEAKRQVEALGKQIDKVAKAAGVQITKSLTEDIRHNPDLDALFSDAGAETAKAFKDELHKKMTAGGLRQNDLLDELFGSTPAVNKLADKIKVGLSNAFRGVAAVPPITVPVIIGPPPPTSPIMSIPTATPAAGVGGIGRNYGGPSPLPFMLPTIVPGNLHAGFGAQAAAQLGAAGNMNLGQSALQGFGSGGMQGAMHGVLGSLAGAGGPLGLIATAIPVVASALGKLGDLPFKAITAGFGAINTTLRNLQSPLSVFGAGLDLVDGAFKSITEHIKGVPLVGQIVGPMLDSIGTFIPMFKDILGSLVQMAGVAFPGSMKLFMYAVEDVQGVIGQTFLPVLNMMRDGIRLFGDVLATILPSTNDMFEALAPLQQSLEQLGDALRDLASDAGPIIRDVLVAGVKTFATVASGLVNIVGWLTRGFTALLSPLTTVLRLLGIAGPAGLVSSVGAAARPANIQGLEEYKRNLQLAAYSQPGQESPIQNVVNWLERIFGILHDGIGIHLLAGAAQYGQQINQQAGVPINPWALGWGIGQAWQ